MLAVEKTKAKIRIFKPKRMIGESEETLAQKRGEMAHMDHESDKLMQSSQIYRVNRGEIAPQQ